MVANTPWSAEPSTPLKAPNGIFSGPPEPSPAVRGFFRKGRAFLAAVVLLVALLTIGSCELFYLDPFPQYLSYEISSLDLKRELQKKGVPGNYTIGKIDILASPLTGKRYVMIYLTFAVGSPYLAILDGANLNIQTVIQDPNIGSMMTVDMSGSLVSAGNSPSYVCRIDPTTFAYSDIGTTINSGNIAGFTDGATTYVIQYIEPNLQGYPYSSGWAPLTSLTLTPLNTVTYYGLYLQSFYTDGTILRFLLTSYMGNSFAVTFPTVLDFRNAFGGPTSSIFGNLSAHTVSLPSADSSGGWMTKGGAVLLQHDNQTLLARYNPDTGAKLDTFVMDNHGDFRYGFSPEGDRWVLYESITGKLHLLRTWW